MNELREDWDIQPERRFIFMLAFQASCTVYFCARGMRLRVRNDGRPYPLHAALIARA